MGADLKLRGRAGVKEYLTTTKYAGIGICGVACGIMGIEC